MKSETNPFVFGKVVTGDNFADRKELVKEMVLDVKSSQNLIIHGPRRLGKSSLMREVLRIMKSDHKYRIVYIDLLRFDRIETICGQIFKELAGTVQKAIEFARDIFKGVSIKIENSSLEMSFGTEEDALIKLFDFLGKYSEKKYKMVVVFDEFQEMVNIAEHSIKKLRSVIQDHQNVSYIFSGSDTRLIDFFIKPEHPFYKFGKLIKLGKPNRKEMSIFLKKKFNFFNLTIYDSELELILSYSANLPYFIQLLAHEIWIKLLLSNSKVITNEIIELTFKNLLERSNSEYEIIWSRMTNNHRKALKILSIYHQPFESKLLQKFKIAQASLQTAITSLEKNQFIWRIDNIIEFLDPIFEKWIKERL